MGTSFFGFEILCVKYIVLNLVSQVYFSVSIKIRLHLFQSVILKF